MTHVSRLDVAGLVAASILLTLSAASGAPSRPAVAEEMSRAYGLDSFGQVEAIRYTWNAQFPGANVSHSWVWEPRTGNVSYEGKDKDGKPVKVTYNRNRLGSESDAVKSQIDPSFINDQYWLLFPLHVAWDGGATVTDEGMHTLPLGKGSAERVVVKYPPDGGYTPGDTWELYVGADKRVEAFIYRRGGPRKPSVVITTWENYKKAGPLLISMEHRGTADGSAVRVWFSGVAIKMTGSDTWMDAR